MHLLHLTYKTPLQGYLYYKEEINFVANVNLFQTRIPWKNIPTLLDISITIFSVHEIKLPLINFDVQFFSNLHLLNTDDTKLQYS